jgi:hypothetical protein
MLWKGKLMNSRQFYAEITTRPPWILDLSLWYAWHAKQETLPAKWEKLSQDEIANELGAHGWLPIRPWKIAFEGVDTKVEQSADEKTIRYTLGKRTLSATWTMGPDGDWWQVEHLVSSPEDFEPALELAGSRRFMIDKAMMPEYSNGNRCSTLVMELPRRPLSDLLHDYLGWGEGLLMLRDFKPEVDRLLEILDGQVQDLLRELVSLPASVFLSPDNLDGQYISPDLFDQSLRPSYAESSDVVHSVGKSLVVHVGGPMKRLLGSIAGSDVDVVEGVSGPPQSDVPLPEARTLAGPDLTLWGGIPQDWLLETTPEDEFKHGVTQVVHQAARDGNVVIGVADRVPVDSDIKRLEMLASIVRGAMT